MTTQTTHNLGYSSAIKDIIGTIDKMWLRFIDYSIVLVFSSWFWSLYYDYMENFLLFKKYTLRYLDGKGQHICNLLLNSSEKNNYKYFERRRKIKQI